MIATPSFGMIDGAVKDANTGVGGILGPFAEVLDGRPKCT
jgi:hypothetical protein